MSEVKKFERGRSRFYPCSICMGEHPSMTTLLDVMGSRALMGWSAKNGVAKLNLFANVLENHIEPDVFIAAKIEAEKKWIKEEGTQFWKSGKQIGQDAADIGTLAHAAIESHLHGKDIDMVSLPDQAKKSVESYLAWEKEHKVKTIATEKTFYGCSLNVAGTADFVGEIDGELTLMDHKTSNGIYPNYIYQCWGYALCDESQHGDRLYKQVAIGRWGKDGESEFKIFKRNEFPGIEQAREIILACGSIFKIQNKYDALHPYKKKETPK